MGNVMAYVSVPKDLTKVKNKVAFNLTKRQILCFGIAAGIGLPFYFLTRNLIGNSNAVMGMVVLMVPAFLFAMYERDGMPLEQVLMNMVTVKFRRPHLRLYETENLYEKPERRPQAVDRKKKKKKPAARKKQKASSGGRNLGRNMDERNAAYRREAGYSSGSGEADLSRRNGEAGVYAAAQRGGRNRARQG